MRDDFPTSEDLVAYLRERLNADETHALEGRLADSEQLRRELDRTREVLAIVDAAGEEATIRRVNDYLDRASQANASDLHVETTSSGGLVRLRVDGVLHVIDELSSEAARACLARLRQLFAMEVENEVQAQDGRHRTTIADRRLDLRGSFLPGIHGGRCCVRLLARADVLVEWDKLGFLPEEDAAVRRILTAPHGLVICTGPTGSGKTTVLYTLLGEVAREAINVMSVEDPVEVDLPWVHQSQIAPQRGMDYVPLLRAIMRQDPDVVMVGEIRDRETAEMVAGMAITGHLVLTQLHTSGTVAAIRRLIDVGLEPYVVSSILRGVVASRLVRAVCPNCGGPAKIRAGEAEQLELDPTADGYRAGDGCETCRQTGYKGRRAAFEILEMNPALRDAIAANSTDDILQEQAFATGLPTLREHAAELVRQGVTTAEEVLRVMSLG